jgi:hypothetical protein
MNPMPNLTARMDVSVVYLANNNLYKKWLLTDVPLKYYLLDKVQLYIMMIVEVSCIL